MGKIEDAIIFATNKHNGQFRKLGHNPYIMHPLEVAQIISTMTEDEDVIIAGLLHDVIEDTDTTAEDIKAIFGPRVLELVLSETENKYRDQDASATWEKRKAETLEILRTSEDIGIKILWLADKLANLRSMYANYTVIGSKVWDNFHQKDPKKHEWYFKTVASYVEDSLKDTLAYKEFVSKIDLIWN